MAYGEDQLKGSKQRYMEDTHQARRHAVEVRRQIPPEFTDTAPVDVPEYVDYYNRVTLEFLSHLQPLKGNFTAKWEEELTTVHVPVDGSEVDVGRVDMEDDGLPPAVYQAPTEPVVVSLSTVKQRWVEKGSVSIRVTGRDLWGTEFDRIVTKRLYLPVRACDAVVDQLNACLNDLGWIPGREQRSVSDDDERDLIEPRAFRS